jgi:imidazolonepropionase-like amidohydrolase
VFEGATLVDGTGAPPIEDAVLVVREGRIECAGSEADCPIPAGAERVDLSGRWMAPGLVDAHVHFAQTAWADGRPDGLNVTDEYPYPHDEVVAERKTTPVVLAS